MGLLAGSATAGEAPTAAERQSIVGVVQEHERRVRPAATDAAPERLVAHNAPQGLLSAFTTNTARFYQAHTQHTFGLTLTAFGYDGQLDPLPAVAPQTTPDQHRVEYPRGPVTEWYVSTRAGTKQGFTAWGEGTEARRHAADPF